MSASLRGLSLPVLYIFVSISVRPSCFGDSGVLISHTLGPESALAFSTHLCYMKQEKKPRGYITSSESSAVCLVCPNTRFCMPGASHAVFWCDLSKLCDRTGGLS